MPDAENDATPSGMVVRDGKVAVLVSPGFGAGWSTWADNAETALYAPDVVAWIEAGKPAVDEEATFGHYGYLGGLRDVEIEWLPVGTRFVIKEYDGSESLTILSPDYGYVAGTRVTPPEGGRGRMSNTKGREPGALPPVPGVDSDPDYMSYSRMSSILTCGEQFRLERIMKVPVTPHLAAVAGNAFHNCVEQLLLSEVKQYDTRNR